MEDAIIKKKLQEYIDTGDKKLLKLMYAVAKEYSENEDEYKLTDEQIQELNKRREMRLTGESKGYTWSDAKKIITGQKKFDDL